MIRVFDLHHEVITAWSELYRAVGTAPAVWTIDFHTDTMPCFRGSAPPPEYGAGCSAETVNTAVAALQHDEHFDWALRAGIISRARIASCMPQTGSPAHPAIAVKQFAGFPDTSDFLNSPEKYRPTAEQLLSDDSLSAAFEDDLPDSEPFIFDIDCDCILCSAALEVKANSLFSTLLKRAALVTLSRESDWVKILKLPGENISGESIAENICRLAEK